jgi:hypothetical protein
MTDLAPIKSANQQQRKTPLRSEGKMSGRLTVRCRSRTPGLGCILVPRNFEPVEAAGYIAGGIFHGG